VYVAIVLGCPRLGGLTVIAVVAAFTLHPDLAGREHLVALAVGAAAAGVQLLMFRRDARRLATSSAATTAGAALHA
jgi:hypothetical protein